MKKKTRCRTLVPAALLIALAGSAGAAEEVLEIEEIVVVGESRTYANSVISESMVKQQAPITSVLSMVDNLPGVSVQEGDTYGFDDWSTNVNIRGFQVNLDEQQVGTTIDGLPNGYSNYGGGAKANRYIDSANLGGIEVSQGTADIASRSNEALGGTINYLTSNPGQELNVRTSATLGDFDAQRYYLRIDTGSIFGSETYAWISASHQEASDWINGAAENKRDHFAGKLVSELGVVDVTAYVSYDDTHEDNYQRLFTLEDWENNQEWDQLTDEWTQVPYIDQLYRRGWSTLRENLFGYLKLDSSVTDSLTLSGSVYYHSNEGRGDWVPPYIVDVIDDMGGPESELLGLPEVRGGPNLGRIYFVDATGAALTPTPGCVSTIGFPYGGAGPEFDPSCYPAGALAVQSYRHTHYQKERTGITADFDWDLDFDGFGNRLRGGVWYEDHDRDEWRDWHKITDTRVGFEYEQPGYWEQYNRTYPQETTKWYLEDTISLAGLRATLGVKQFLVDIKRQDNFGDTAGASVDSDSDVLFSGGVVWETPIEGLELFVGYAENFKAFSDDILETPDADLESLEPETADSTDVGVRWILDNITFAVTYYSIEFNDRIIFLSAETEAGPDYLIGTNGTYFNAGGLDSEGFEVSGTINLTENLSMYAAYTFNDSTYLGTGDPLVDEAVGIVPGNEVTGTPENMLVVSFDWSRGPFTAGVSTKYTDKRPITIDNEWIAEDYTIVDLYGGVRGDEFADALKGLELLLVINNLLDEEYLGGISGQGAWIGAPRTASLTLTMDF